MREGAMFFPPDVMRISFFRSTMDTWPSGSTVAISSVMSQPSIMVFDGGACRSFYHIENSFRCVFQFDFNIGFKDWLQWLL